jgi:hypothetical protein
MLTCQSFFAEQSSKWQGGFRGRHTYFRQAADLFSWGIFRKYEKRDTEWYKIFNSKIRYESKYLP